jgi:hypothetical protein
VYLQGRSDNGSVYSWGLGEQGELSHYDASSAGGGRYNKDMNTIRNSNGEYELEKILQ